MSISKDINDFCDKYGVTASVLTNYIESYKIGDSPSIDLYEILIFEECTPKLLKDMRSELKELLEKYIG